MYDLPFTCIDKSEFLAGHWQKSPCLFKQAFTSPKPLVSAEELAGLALEEEVESRVVSHVSNHWQIEYGPFGEAYFQNLPEENWTLLVQSVDCWLTTVNGLLADFSFLPRWRFDDVMVSFATNGGGVGPHADNYDVFLIQTQGKRRWRVGRMGDTKNAQQIIKGISHLAEFEVEIDYVMEPGDMLYIPPDTPHWGESVGESMGYSVGYRSLQSDQLLSILAEDLSKQSSFEYFFADPYRQKVDHTNHLDIQIVEWAQSELLVLAQQPARLAQLIGKHLSLSKIDPLHTHTPFDIQLLTNDSSIKIDNFFSVNWHQSLNAVSLNIEGESYVFEAQYLPIVRKLASYQQVPIKLFNFSTEPFDFPEVLTSLINRGYIKHIK